MPETAEPFAVYLEPGAGEVNDPLAEFLPPDLVQARRAAILERAAAGRQQREEAAEQARRQDAHDDYVARWTMARRFELAARGKNPNDSRNLPMTHDELAARAFYQQDAETAEALRQAKAKARQVFADAGLPGQHVVNVAGSSSPQSPPADPGSSSDPGSLSGAGTAARASALGTRIRAALGRMDRSDAERCTCAACVPGSVRSDDGSRPLDHGDVVTRSFGTGPGVVR